MSDRVFKKVSFKRMQATIQSQKFESALKPLNRLYRLQQRFQIPNTARTASSVYVISPKFPFNFESPLQTIARIQESRCNLQPLLEQIHEKRGLKSSRYRPIKRYGEGGGQNHQVVLFYFNSFFKFTKYTAEKLSFGKIFLKLPRTIFHQQWGRIHRLWAVDRKILVTLCT